MKVYIVMIDVPQYNDSGNQIEGAYYSDITKVFYNYVDAKQWLIAEGYHENDNLAWTCYDSDELYWIFEKEVI